MSEYNTYSIIDKSSYSNPDAILISSIHLDWNINFDLKLIQGSVKQSCETIIDGTNTIDLDSRSLTIFNVFINKLPVEYKVDEETKALGSKISVTIPSGLRIKGSKYELEFVYSQSTDASAVQWLDKESTAGGQYPYVFTQCQAIHARSLLPCQDAPGTKIPYTAKVTAPKWATVLMSALSESSNEEGVFYFTQKVPVSAYLIALAAGNLASREISDRCRVWSEPEVVDAAAYEFSETEEFLQTAESLTCPYVWTRYDILLLPPSFPYGGMENPMLTFATPTLLAGDKSLADVIAHEISHSWTGNLVTNATWEHFWLNEGWTVWLERKIMSRMKGIEFLKLSSQGGYTHLADDINNLGVDNKYTCLCWPMVLGEDPDDGFSSVPYEKGFNLLWMLENITGTPEFEGFAKAYILNFQSSTVTSGSFKDFFMEYFSSAPTEVKAKIDSIDWIKIFHTTGMPAHVNDFSNSLSEKAEKLAKYWIDVVTNKGTTINANASDIEGWNTKQVCIFLEALLIYGSENEPVSNEILVKIDEFYSFTSCNNSEIKHRWQSLCIMSEVEWIIPHVVKFITSQGRMKFTRPLYRALFNSKMGKEIAIETFTKNSKIYHPICRKMVASDLKI